MFAKLVIGIAVLQCCCQATKFARNDDAEMDFTDHQMIRIMPTTLEQVKQLQKLELDFEMDYWNPALEDLRPVLTIVDPQRQFFLNSLNESAIKYEVLASNYQKVVDSERAQIRMGRNTRSFNYQTYNQYSEIVNHLKQLAAEHSDKASYGSVGQSYEGREIPYLRIGNQNGQAIFFECGIHSREWVTIAFCTWVSNELLTNPELVSYTSKYQFIVVPVLNVDGYVYTHTTNRMWRKTRSRQSGTNCVGADPNRNFDSSFCKVGASSNPCSDTYCGKSAFSEVEALNMAYLAKDYHGNIAAYFAIHSYSQLWMYPWGYTYSTPSNTAHLNRISDAAVNAIYGVNRLSFTRGSIANTIYLASGSSVDYMFDSMGVKVSFALELRDKGQYGFNLPASQIAPACRETLAGLKAAIDQL